VVLKSTSEATEPTVPSG